MSKQFKDFNKDVNDLITKGILKPGDWKIETKSKGAGDCLDSLVLNPTVTRGSKDSTSVALEGKCKQFNVEGKMKFTQGVSISDEITYTGLSGHKIKVSCDDVCKIMESPCTIALEDECKIGDLAAIASVSAKGPINVHVAYQVVPQALVGGGIRFDTNKGLSGWDLGVRAEVFNGCFVNATTDSLEKHKTGVICPLKLISDKTTTVAAQVDCGKEFSMKVGIQQPCILCPCNTWKVVVDNKAQVTIASIIKFADNWKASISMSLQNCCKFGFELVRE